LAVSTAIESALGNMSSHGNSDTDRQTRAPEPERPTSRCIDWYAEGQSRMVEVDGVHINVRFVGRKGRKARISIEAPAGAVFTQEAMTDD